MTWKPETKERWAKEKARRAAIPTVRCTCGAVWRGRYAENNSIIDAHRQRPGHIVVTEPKPKSTGAS